MPIYDFQCPKGHLTERRAAYGQDSIVCPCCEEQAFRVRVYVDQYIFGETCAKNMRPSPVPRDEKRYGKELSLFQEACQEIDHAATKQEERTGHPLKTPNYFRMGVKKAKRILAGQEAPLGNA